MTNLPVAPTSSLPNTPMKFFFLSERTVPLLFWEVMCGRPVCVIKVIAVLPGMGSLFERVLTPLRKAGKITPLECVLPELTRYVGLDFYANVHFRYDKIEPWIDRMFRFADIDGTKSDLAIAYKKAVWSKMYVLAQCAVIAHRLNECAEPDSCEILGVTNHINQIHEIHYGHALTEYAMATSSIAEKSINALLTLMIAIYGFLWLLPRVRVANPRQVQTFFGTNMSLLKLAEELKPYSEAVVDHEKIRLILNSPALIETAKKQVPDIHFGVRGGGRFSVPQALSALASMVGSMLRFHREVGHLPAMIFAAVIILPYKQLVYRGLFNRYRFAYFFLLNEYAEESAVLASEARRTGCTVMGQIHGVPVTEILAPFWRYVDMDICYIPLKIPFATDYRNTWPERMMLRPVRSRGLIKERRHKLHTKKTNDIVFFFSSGIYMEQMTETVLAVARAFPDRTIYLCVKANQVVEEICAGMTEELTSAEHNIVRSNALSYDLMIDCGYAFGSCSSSIAIEAVQFGLKTFVLDFRPEDQPMLYRQFPEFCVRSADQAVARIKNLETDAWEYPWTLYEEIMGLSDQSISEAMQYDLYGDTGEPAAVETTKEMHG